MLLRLAREIDLKHDRQWRKPGRLAHAGLLEAIEALDQFRAIQGLHNLKERGGARGFIRLQGPDEMPFERRSGPGRRIREQRFDGGAFQFGFLNAISPNRVRPREAASATASGGWVLMTAISRTSAGSRRTRAQASAMPGAARPAGDRIIAAAQQP